MVTGSLVFNLIFPKSFELAFGTILECSLAMIGSMVFPSATACLTSASYASPLASLNTLTGTVPTSSSAPNSASNLCGPSPSFLPL